MNDKKKKYDIAYVKSNVKQIKFNLNKVYDEDIILYLKSKDNVNAYLKRLVREEMKKWKMYQRF